jgi:hypothetical protein
MIVPFIILFQNAENSDFLDSQWLASAVAIAVTYIVFIMGMPALMFQTFIPESFRNIYNERFNWKWSNFFRQKLIIVIILFLISDGVISSLTSDLISSIIFGDEVCFEISGIPCTPKTVSDAILAAIIIGVIAYIQIRGYKHLLDNFKSTRNAAQQISDEIARHAIMIFDATGDVPQKDIEDLSIMAKELDSGQIKNQFLDSCESIVEHILASPLGVNKKDLIKLLMDSTICRSVLADGSRADGSNRRRVLKSLMTVHKFKSVKSFKPLKLTQREKKEVKVPAPKEIPIQ